MTFKLTNEDKSSIHHFYNEHGNLDRWSGYEEKKHLIEAEYPELIAALKAKVVAERTLEAIVNSIYNGF